MALDLGCNFLPRGFEILDLLLVFFDNCLATLPSDFSLLRTQILLRILVLCLKVQEHIQGLAVDGFRNLVDKFLSSRVVLVEQVGKEPASDEGGNLASR